MMFKTLKNYFEFCNDTNRKKLYKAMILGVLKAMFATLRIPAIAVILQGIIDRDMSMRNVWMSLGIMCVSLNASDRSKL